MPPGGSKSAGREGGSERRARDFERYRAYAAAAGYAGLFALFALAFFHLVAGGLDKTWAKALFWTATGVAAVVMLVGIGVNYERVLDLFISRRGKAGMSVALALASGFVILVALNVISYRHYRSWDVTENARFTLSEPTMNWLARVEQGEEILRIVTFIPYDVKSRFTGLPPNAKQLVVELLKLYGDNCKRIVVQHMEVERRRAAAIETAKALGIRENRIPTESVVLKYGDKRRDVSLRDMIKADSPMFGGPRRPPVFKGEDAITSVIRDLLQEKPKKVYFVTGHGERTPGYDPLDMSTAVEDLKGMNFKIEELDLVREERVPDDADCIVIAGPTRPIPSGERGAIERYLDGGGSMLVLVDNTVTNRDRHPSGIERILKPYGIIVRQDRVGVGPETRRARITKGIPASTHDLSAPFRRREALLYQPCCLETEKAEKEDYGVRPILEGTDGSWGESEFGPQFAYDEKEDMEGPTVLGVTAVPAGEDEAGKARIVVFADVDWLTNQQLEDPIVMRYSVNVHLFVASVNWMVGRMENIGIPPKEEDVRIADVKQDQRTQLFAGVVIGPVLLMMALGIYVWRVRSR